MKILSSILTKGVMFLLATFIFSICTNSAQSGLIISGVGSLIVTAANVLSPGMAFNSIVPNMSEVANMLTGAYGYYTEQDLEYLGAVARAQGVNLSKSQLVEMAKASNAMQAKKTVERTISEDAQFLIAKRASLPVDTQIAVNTGTAKLIMATYYSRKLVVGGGNNSIQDIIQQKDDQFTGRTNISNAKLEQGMCVGISHIGVRWAFNGSSVDTPETQSYTNALLTETDGTPTLVVPEGLVNGEMEIFIDNKSIGMRVPIREFLKDGVSIQNSMDKNNFAVKLPAPVIWKGGQIIGCQIILAEALPTSGTPDVNRYFFEVSFYGVGIKS